MWLDDGSACVKAEAGSPEFHIEGEVKGSPVNALYDRALTSGQYFEIDVLALKESVFVGVTTKASFAQGWKCKGLFFGRNLSDGGSAVRMDFGEHVTVGQRIGVLSEFDDATVTVTFYQSGRCLGPAFVAKRPSGAELFPVVHTSSSGDKFAIRFPDAPGQRQRQAPDGTDRHPAEGVWALQQLCTGPELGMVPLADKVQGRDPTLKIESKGAGKFRFAFRVCNSLMMEASSEADASLAPFDKLTPGRVMGTKMMGPPGLMEVESIVSQGLEGLHKWLAQPGSLLLTGATCEMSFAPQSDSPEAVPATEVELR